jgi:hypothetical protein
MSISWEGIMDRIKRYLFLLTAGIFLILGGSNADRGINYIKFLKFSYTSLQFRKERAKIVDQQIKKMEENGVLVIDDEESYQKLLSAIEDKYVIVGVVYLGSMTYFDFTSPYTQLVNECKDSDVLFSFTNVGLSADLTFKGDIVDHGVYAHRLADDGYIFDPLQVCDSSYLVGIQKKEIWREVNIRGRENLVMEEITEKICADKSS